MSSLPTDDVSRASSRRWPMWMRSSARASRRRGMGCCKPLQIVAPLSWRVGRSPRGTVGSKRFHPLEECACRSNCSMLLAMRANSPRPPPIPECSGAAAATLSAPPPALALLHSDVVWRQSMAVTTVVGNLAGGTLAAAVSARERNDERAISRNRAPATN